MEQDIAASAEDQQQIAAAPLPQQLKFYADRAGLAEWCGFELKEADFAKLSHYCQAVWNWNEKINLTRHTTAELFVNRDLIDTLQLVKHLELGERVLDFGSGSGVPGLVAAILRPDLKIALCDSVQKKARVLEDVVSKLKLVVEVHDCNVKDVLAKKKYDVLTARAVGSLSKMCTWLSPFWGRFGRLLTIKGPGWVDERGEARHLGQLRTLDLRKLAEYKIPERDNASVVLQITQKSRVDSAVEDNVV